MCLVGGAEQVRDIQLNTFRVSDPLFFVRPDGYLFREGLKVAPRKAGDSRKAWEVDFVHVDLTKQDKQALDKWDVDGRQTIDYLSRVSLDGYKLSFVHDNRNDCCIASLTSPKVEGGARQMCLSARGPDLWQSMRVLAFKCIIILDSDLATMAAVGEARSQWG